MFWPGPDVPGRKGQARFRHNKAKGRGKGTVTFSAGLENGTAAYSDNRVGSELVRTKAPELTAGQSDGKGQSLMTAPLFGA